VAVAGFADLDFQAFHRDELPARMAGGRDAAAARAMRGAGSLGFRLPTGEAYTYLPRADRIEVLAGDALADTLIELDHDAWEGLVHDYESAPGLLYGGRVRCARGDAMRFVRWEPGLRALYAGREIYDPGSLDLRDADGRPLDVERVFPAGAAAEETSHFLRTAGYLFVRGVFAAEEVDAFLAEARALRAEAVPGDRLSWWSRDAAGGEVLCRVTRAADKPALATLRADPRVLGLVALAGTPLVNRDGEGNGVTVIYKNPGIREGLSDLPWHRDCGMGGHSLMCPLVIASVYLTPATPETGELRFLPGSAGRTCGFIEADDERAPRSAGFAAQPGDVSIHFGDVMHAAPPPKRLDLDTYRISAVVGFARPDARVHRGRSYNEALHRSDDGQIEHLAAVARNA
jgi:hypothetical protein